MLQKITTTVESRRMRPLHVSSLVLAAVLAACNSTDISKARLPYEAGHFDVAADEISAIHPGGKKFKKNRPGDNIWLLIEKGKMLMDAGRFEESNIAFYEANRILETLDEEATISLGAVRSGAGALLLDDCQADYCGNSYDRILLPAYVAVNHLMLGQFGDAAVASRQQRTWQMKAEEARSKELAKIREMDDTAESEGLGFTSRTAVKFIEAKYALADDKEKSQGPQDTIRTINASTSKWATPAFNDYSIPFGRFVGALALSANGKSGEANGMVDVLRGMVPNCQPLREPLLKAQTAYVIFENGLVPKRNDETVSFWYTYTAEQDVYNDAGDKIGTREVQVPSKIVLPFVGLRSGRTAVKGPDKQLTSQVYAPANSLRMDAGGQVSETTMLHDMEGVVAQEFKEALTGQVARILIRAAIQEATQIVANNNFGLLGVIGGTVAKGTIDPDLRGWESLGAQHQIAVVTVPDSGIITFSTTGPAGGASQEISVPVGPPVFVYARSTGADNLIVHSCPLVTN